MPLLDVSEVLDDPMFQDSAIVIRSTETVNSHGEAVVSMVQIPIVGFFMSGYSLPGGDGGLVRQPQGERNSNGLTAITKFPILMGDRATGLTADIIRFMGSDFVVTAQNDYSNFGEGYFLCLADQLAFNP